ncbi:MAG: heavy metal sensor histidine kinase [Verrucomicrobiaceae bacterium]|nr:heavy metal sensor histidine kinase [Verrucomicrobiaceae bacterium]
MKSFRARLVLSFTLLTAVVTALVAAWAYQSSAEALRDDTDRLLRDRAYVLSKSVTPMAMRLQPWMEAFLETDKTGLRVQVLDPDGAVLTQSANLTEALPLSSSAREASATNMSSFTETVKLKDGTSVRVASVPVTTYRDNRNTVIGFAQAAMPESTRDERLHAILMRLIGAVIAATLVAWLLATVLAKAWLRSVDAAAESAHRIGSGETLRERLFVPKDEDEVARLARAFNELLDKLEEAHGTQQRFLADASHELRTPLTVLRGEIEVALRRERPANEYREVLESSREEIERLTKLTENLLSLARSDAGESIATREPVDLVALCERVRDSLTAQAETKRIALTVDAPQPVWVNGDAVALERVCLNLVENAIRYSPAGESVMLRAMSEHDEAVLSVSDTGPGIGADHLPHLFERFYRVDKARSREHGGAGLGLAIVEALVKAHGGSVAVASTVGRGTTFMVRLPVA